MEALIKHATLAWNPIRETRTRLHEGTLTPGAIAMPFLAVVIGCNLVAGGAQQFFNDAVAFGAGMQLTNHPLVTNPFAQRVLATLGALAPAAAVALLPTRVFVPAGRAATVASIIIFNAAWAFYGAALGTPVYILAGSIATSDLELGLGVFAMLMVPAMMAIFVLLVWCWIMVLRGVLRLTYTALALVTFSAAAALGILVTAVLAMVAA